MAVLQHLTRLRPDLSLTIRTQAPAFLFEEVEGDVELRPGVFDHGMVQEGPLIVDVERTLEQVHALMLSGAAIVEGEVEQFGGGDVVACVADIPAIGCLVGQGLGVPTFGLGNFDWCWIYEAYREAHPGFGPIIEWMWNAYQAADGAFRPPMHCGLKAFTRVWDVPLIVRQTSLSRDSVLEKLRIPLGTRHVILVSSGGFEPARMQPPDIGPDSGVHIISCIPLPGAKNVTILPRNLPISHPDLVEAADLVIGKLGYGTLAECAASGTAILYPGRLGFREHPILETFARENLDCAVFDAEDFTAGRWASAVKRVLDNRTRTTRADASGASRVAGALLRSIDGQWSPDAPLPSPGRS